jgi:hypothetical protein
MARTNKFSGSPAHSQSQIIVGQESAQRAGKRRRMIGLNQYSRDSLLNYIRNSTKGRANDRFSKSHCFEKNQAKPLACAR